MASKPPPGDSHDLARSHVAASPLFLRDAEVARGVALMLLGNAQLMRHADAALRDAGIGRAHYRLLSLVARWPGQSVVDLVPLAGTSKQALARVARDLEMRALVRVATDGRDKRRRTLSATAQGMALVAGVDAALNAAMADAYGGAGQAAVTGYWRVLEGLLPVAVHARMADMSRRK